MQFKVLPVGHSKATMLRNKQYWSAKNAPKYLSSHDGKQTVAPNHLWHLLRCGIWLPSWQRKIHKYGRAPDHTCKFAVHLQSLCFPFSKLASHQFPGRQSNHCVYDAPRERYKASRTLGKGKNQLSNLKFSEEEWNNLLLIHVATMLLYIEKFHIYWVTQDFIPMDSRRHPVFDLIFYSLSSICVYGIRSLTINSNPQATSCCFEAQGKHHKVFCCLDIIFPSEQEPNIAVWTLHWESVTMSSLQQ